MSDETLLTVSRRFVRFFNIDMEKGGMVVDETLQASRDFDREIQLADLGKEHDVELLKVAKDAALKFNLNMTRHGGLVSTDTEIAVNQLNKAVIKLAKREETSN